MKWVLIAIFVSTYAHPAPMAAEFENLAACDLAKVEIQKRIPGREIMTLFCTPKGQN